MATEVSFIYILHKESLQNLLTDMECEVEECATVTELRRVAVSAWHLMCSQMGPSPHVGLRTDIINEVLAPEENYVADSFQVKLQDLKIEFNDAITSWIGKCDMLPYQFADTDYVPVWDRHFKCPPPKLKAFL
ncbi:hypothetical protein PR048_012946 [Dryococelus australis]|uniref:Uncharacterized protein n=1 Tax=Dryococelus australis TaxID=614101 RepID=A0ABQ9HRL1_9NEOP|nr:hypothetical protein PR048_012946 [Dryococelus australis]